MAPHGITPLRANLNKLGMLLLISSLLAWAIRFGALLEYEHSRKEALVQDCIADGHKEYQCR